MSEPLYDIIFRGDIVLGHQLADVKIRLQQLFKTDAAKIDALFSGRPVPLKRNLNLQSAQKYRDALVHAGAQVEVAAVNSVKTSPPQAAQSSTLQSPIQQPSSSPKPIVTPDALERGNEPKLENERWSLAPVGSYLLPVTKQHLAPLPSIDTSALSLRPEGSNLLDSSEQKAVVIEVVIAPNFELARVGADLVRADEKFSLPIMDVEVEDWDIAELGADMLRIDEKEIAALPVINVPDVGLAPVGADLGQIKVQLKAVTPNISGMQLVE